METPQRHIIDELKKNTVPVPSDDYFASLKSGLMEQAAIAPLIPLYRRKWLLGSVAAAAIACLLTIRFWNADSEQTAVDWESVSQEELLAYVEDNIDQFDTHTIAAQLDSIPEWHSNLETVTPGPIRNDEAQQGLFDELKDEEILEYLEEEVIELDDELLIGS